MKTIIAITFAVFLFTACGSGGSVEPTVTDSTGVDSISVDSVKVAIDSTK